MTLEQFCDSCCEISAAEFASDESRPVDLVYYPQARVYRYSWRFDDGASGHYYIIESAGRFAFLFLHPSDALASSLPEAERQLHHFIASEWGGSQ